MDSWIKNPVIFEINTWVWLWELSQEMHYPVTLANVPDSAWDELAQFNIDAVWLMGVWERSPAGISVSNQHPGNLADFREALADFTVEDNVGSPYCVRQYVVDKQLGGNEGLAVARSQFHRHGIKLILDFVPNHLAHDHSWVTDYPSYFIGGSWEDLRDDPESYAEIGGHVFTCGKDPFFPAWQDVVQVNAFHPGLREAAIETVIKIAGQCDGVRCDMAMLLVNDVFERTWVNRAGPRPESEYWEVLIPAVKRNYENFIFIAEAYWDLEWTLQQQGFDYCYDKRLYDRLKDENAQSIRLHLMADTGYQSKLIRFIENHDEARQTVVFQSDKNRAAAVISSTLPGAKLYHDGQFEGRRVRVPVFLRRRPYEPEDKDLFAFYKKLLNVIHHPVFKEGTWQLCECTGWPGNEGYQNLFAWYWHKHEEQFLIAVNYSGQTVEGRITLARDNLRGAYWQFKDSLSDDIFERNGDEMHNPGLYVALGPWQFHFLQLIRQI